MIKINTVNQEQIKQINRVNILNVLRKHKTITKLEIAKMLNISIPTVTTNINLLKEDGLVEEAGIAESTGGRKPIILKLSENARYSFGIDISPKDVKLILCNLYSEVIEESFFHTIGMGFEQILNRILQWIKTCMQKFTIQSEKVLGVGFSLPGLIDEENLILLSSPNLGVKNFSFTTIQKELNLPIYIENEANVAAYAELVLGRAIDKDNLIYVSITEGVGTGIIIQHTIYKSVSKMAGEFGHMRITDEPKLCKCGRTGCWELYASKQALLDNYFELTGQQLETLSAFFEKYQSGNDFASEALEQYIHYLMIGIENLILALDPEYVIIGGEIALYQNDLKEMLETHPITCSLIEHKKDKIIFSELGDKGSLVGAALLPFDQLFHFTRIII